MLQQLDLEFFLFYGQNVFTLALNRFKGRIDMVHSDQGMFLLMDACFQRTVCALLVPLIKVCLQSSTLPSSE